MGWPYLTAAEIAAAARAGGFPDRDLQVMTAIAIRESGRKATAHNPNALTGDNSYGLWQINMIGQMGEDRRGYWNLERNEDLWDPVTNAKAAYALYRGRINAGQPRFSDWSVWLTGSYLSAMSEAAEGVRNIGGVTVPESQWSDGGGGASSVSYGGTEAQEISFEADNANLSFGLGFSQMLGRLFGNLSPEVMEGLPGGSALAGLGTTLGAIADFMMIWTAALSKTVVWVSNPDNWVRLAQVVLGGALVLSGASIVARPYTAPLVQAGAAVATKGKAAKGGSAA